MSTRRFPVRLIQLLSLVLCYSLLFSTLLIIKPQASLAGNGQGQAGPPVGARQRDVASRLRFRVIRLYFQPARALQPRRT